MLFPLLLSATVATVPTGVAVEPSGFWTVTSAPPAPFQPVTTVAAKSSEQVAAERAFLDYARWQGGAMMEFGTLVRRLETAESGNFVSARFDQNGGQHRAVFSFLRRGPETLRRYSARPDFVGETVRWSMAEQAAASDKITAFLQAEGVRFSGGYGNAENNVRFKLGITEAEWRALAAKRNFRLPEPVALTFADAPAGVRNAPLLPELARGIRLFARATQERGPVEDVASTARFVLADGCFRINTPTGAHAVFPLGSRLHRDAQGYLRFGEPGKAGTARVGEQARFHGIAKPAEPTVAAAVRAACGSGEVLEVGAPESAEADRLQDIADQSRWLRSSLGESYGLSSKGIDAYIADCEKRWNGSACRDVPPPPAMGSCPPGTSKLAGLCRTPQGHIRPLPSYLEPYAKL